MSHPCIASIVHIALPFHSMPNGHIIMCVVRPRWSTSEGVFCSFFFSLFSTTPTPYGTTTFPQTNTHRVWGYIQLSGFFLIYTPQEN